MGTGIIIVCHDYQDHLNSTLCVQQFNSLRDYSICLVNNNSKDNTYELLKGIRDKCQNVSVVNIKKFKSDGSAVKAGVRYLQNKTKLLRVGYIHTDHIGSKNDLGWFLFSVIEHQSDLFGPIQSVLIKTSGRLKAISIIEQLERITYSKTVQSNNF